MQWDKPTKSVNNLSLVVTLPWVQQARRLYGEGSDDIEPAHTHPRAMQDSAHKFDTYKSDCCSFTFWDLAYVQVMLARRARA